LNLNPTNKMPDPKRYAAKTPWYAIETFEHPIGEFVLYADYAMLKNNVERLEKDVWRMKVFKGIDEDTKSTLKDALNTVPEWAKVLETIENNARLETDNITLKAQVERLTYELEKQDLLLAMANAFVTDWNAAKERNL